MSRSAASEVLFSISQIKIDIPLDVIIKRKKKVPINKDDHPPADEQSKTKALNCIMIVGAAGTSLQFAILILLLFLLVIHCLFDVKVVCENFITTAHQHDDDAERSASKPYLRCVQFILFFFLLHRQRKNQVIFNLELEKRSQSAVQIEMGLIASDETFIFSRIAIA